MDAPSSHHAAFRKQRHFASLDGLRCLAILPVIWHHSLPQPVAGVLGKGPFGVDLFFAISGFLITTLLLRERDRHGRIDLPKFYWRRSLRIFPLYYAVLALHVLFMALCFSAGPQRTHFFANLVYFATYTSNWFLDTAVSHPITFAFAWSLAAEEQFYLTFPWVLRFVKGPWAPALLVAAALGIDLGAEYGTLCFLLPAGSMSLHIATCIAAPICLGALLAIAAHHRGTYRVLSWLFGWRLSAPALLLLIVWLLARPGTANFTVHVVLAALVAACCLREDHALAPLLGLTPLAHIGKVSYGIYLLHTVIIGTLRTALPLAELPALLFVIATILSVLAATASYRWFEQPFLRLKDRYQPGPGASTVHSAPAGLCWHQLAYRRVSSQPAPVTRTVPSFTDSRTCSSHVSTTSRRTRSATE